MYLNKFLYPLGSPIQTGLSLLHMAINLTTGAVEGLTTFGAELRA
jgi:hypothetical protein